MSYIDSCHDVAYQWFNGTSCQKNPQDLVMSSGAGMFIIFDDDYIFWSISEDSSDGIGLRHSLFESSILLLFPLTPI